MRAIQFARFGGPEVLEQVEVPEPHAAAGQIRVAVKAVGVNPADWKLRQGMMGGELPRGTGLEVAGVVDEVGDGVTDVSVGEEVFGSVEGPSAQRKRPRARQARAARGLKARLRPSRQPTRSGWLFIHAA
jgi:NADPH:quinone reductase-like Zn-dependent oxidoreductase